MAAEPVGERLDERRLAVLARPADVLRDDLADGEDVHPVHSDARHAQSLRLAREVGHGGVALDRRPHSVEVVLDQEDDRQLPQRGEVHRLAEVAAVRRAVPEHADGDRILALVLGGESQARRDREVAADDAIAAHEAALGVEDVHRPAAAARAAVLAAEELGHHVLRVGAAGDRVTVGAVSADQVVVGPHHRRRADDRRLLPDRQVQEAAGLRLLVLAARLLLEAANERHGLEQLAAGVRVGKRVRGRSLAVAGRRHGRPLSYLRFTLGHRRSR